MPLHTKLADDVTEVDVIIAGGGTAGCVVAARLAEADPSLVILLIEGGLNNKDMPTVRIPVLYPSHLMSDSKTAIFYKGNKSAALADREPIVPAGGVLGGGSSINFMLYTRAQRCDYDAWNMPGWNTDEVLPFMKMIETYHGSTDDPSLHGYHGPINVTPSTQWPDARDQFFAAAASMGWPEIKDLQDLDSHNGVQAWQRYIGTDGLRQDAAHTYLHPKLDGDNYPNLHVLIETKIRRVLFDENKRAIGVEYTPNAARQPNIANLAGHPHASIKARKLVVISAGAIGTPLILERSGVGSADILTKAGVDVVEDLASVGTDYQDHHLVVYPYHTNLSPEQTLDAFASGRLDVAALVAAKDQRLTTNGIPVAGKLRMTAEEAAALGPEFLKAWDRDFRDNPNKPTMLVALINYFLGDPTLVAPGQYVTAATFTAYPYSRGHVHITGPDLADPYDFETGFLSDAHNNDVKQIVWAYKKQRELLRHMPLFRGEVPLGHPRFPEGSAASLTVHDPDAVVDPSAVVDLVYSEEDDIAIEKFVRANVNTAWHSLGTCKCAPRERGGVVDESLSVYGVEALKLIDLSVVPVNVGANTNNTALVIGEKGADIIIRELGLNK